MLRDSSHEVMTLHHGDARQAGALLAAAASSTGRPGQPFLTATVTSPPYADMIDYKLAEQIGFGQSFEMYLKDCQGLFEEIYRWTREDGSLWLVADTYLDGGSAAPFGGVRRPSRLKLLPFELAAAAERAGWVLRDVIIWHKNKTLPWSGHGRLRNSFEYVLFLVKSDSFQYHVDRVRNQSELGRWWVRYPERYNPFGVAPENVWSIPIPVQGSWGRRGVRHACPFPSELVRRILLLSTNKNDVVFDPFAGSGTAVAVAEAMERRGIGIELSREHVDAYYDSVRPGIRQQWKGKDSGIPSQELAATILELRAIKYAKVLLNRFRDDNPGPCVPVLGAALVDVPREAYFTSSALPMTIAFVLSDECDEARGGVFGKMQIISQRPPLSKFGIAASIRVIDKAEFVELTVDRDLYAYEHGHTWTSSGLISATDALLLQPSNGPGKHIPIVANVKLNLRFPEHD